MDEHLGRYLREIRFSIGSGAARVSCRQKFLQLSSRNFLRRLRGCTCSSDIDNIRETPLLYVTYLQPMARNAHVPDTVRQKDCLRPTLRFGPDEGAPRASGGRLAVPEVDLADGAVGHYG